MCYKNVTKGVHRCISGHWWDYITCLPKRITNLYITRNIDSCQDSGTAKKKPEGSIRWSIIDWEGEKLRRECWALLWLVWHGIYLWIALDSVFLIFFKWLAEIPHVAGDNVSLHICSFVIYQALLPFPTYM